MQVIVVWFSATTNYRHTELQVSRCTGRLSSGRPSSHVWTGPKGTSCFQISFFPPPLFFQLRCGITYYSWICLIIFSSRHSFTSNSVNKGWKLHLKSILCTKLNFLVLQSVRRFWHELQIIFIFTCTNNQSNSSLTKSAVYHVTQRNEFGIMVPSKSCTCDAPWDDTVINLDLQESVLQD